MAAGGAKRKHEKSAPEAALVAVPAKSARLAGPVSAAAAPTWDWREPEPFEDSRETMSKVVQWHLLDFVRTYKDDSDLQLSMVDTLESIKPLRIDSKSAGSYKEMWEDEHALLSLHQNKMYEAGASIFWCAMGQESSKFFFDAVSWESMEDFESNLFGESAKVHGQFLFPTTIHLWVSKSMEESAGSLEKLLKVARYPILNGMTTVNAWYLAVARALKAKDGPRTKALLKAGLSVTLHLRRLESEADGYKQAMNLSGNHKLSAQANGESLLSWLVRYEFLSKEVGTTVVAQHVKFAQSQAILFDLKPVTTSVMTAVIKIKGVLTEKSRAILQSMSLRYSSKIFLEEYSKLLRIVYCLQRYPAAERMESTFFEYCMESSLVGLIRNQVKPDFFKTNNMGAETKGGKPGFADLCAARMLFVDCVENFLSSVQNNQSKSELMDVWSKFKSPVAWNEDFPVVTAEKSGEDEVVQTPLEKFNKGKSKLSNQLATMGLDSFANTRYEGEYDADLLVLSTFYAKIPSVLMEPAEAEKKLALVVASQDLFRAIEVATTVVSTSESTATPLRTLAKSNSLGDDPEEKKRKEERQAAWKAASKARKTVVQFAVFHDTAQATEVVASSITASTKTEAGKSHRLVVLSVDLLQESDTKPWVDPFDGKPTAMKFDSRLEWVLKQSQPGDIKVVFDGRSRKARKHLEQEVAKSTMGANAVELSIIYSGKHPYRMRTREVAFGSRPLEIGFMLTVFSRSKMQVRERKTFAGAGEESTFCTTYTGVSWPASLPMIDAQDKQRIFAAKEVATPKKWSRSGVPLFWHESKSIAWWRQFLVDLQVTSVVDMSPGSASLACACMSSKGQSNVHYIGFAHDAAHQSFLANVTDRASLVVITTHGSSLYESSLAETVSQVFADILASESKEDEPLQSESEDEDEVAGKA
ncbi:Cdkl4 [Symbiodinium sp. CCMP2592]|nr:Cdkl4 [Symbiodinium sp. CCMP2592]